MPIGARVTLRGERMWEFLDRLITVALPRVRDFRGVPTKSFDGRGNYTLGVRDHLIFPEIDYNKVEKTEGDEHHDRDDGRQRRARALPAARARHAVRQGVRRLTMATTAKIAKDAQEAEVRRSGSATVARVCGRPRGFYCASSGSAASVSATWRCRGYLPGVIKASW